MAREHESIKLTREMLSRSRVIARGRGIRDVQRLVRTHGGSVRGWVKKSSPIMLFGGRRIEVHWYEHHGIGRFEQKLVHVGQS
jgi:hypothetical protein